MKALNVGVLILFFALSVRANSISITEQFLESVRRSTDFLYSSIVDGSSEADIAERVALYSATLSNMLIFIDVNELNVGFVNSSYLCNEYTQLKKLTDGIPNYNLPEHHEVLVDSSIYTARKAIKLFMSKNGIRCSGENNEKTVDDMRNKLKEFKNRTILP